MVHQSERAGASPVKQNPKERRAEFFQQCSPGTQPFRRPVHDAKQAIAQHLVIDLGLEASGRAGPIDQLAPVGVVVFRATCAVAA